MMFGSSRESGVWLASASRRRFMFRGHDALYIAFGRVRVRIMR
jgi:hypothetical protein